MTANDEWAEWADRAERGELKPAREGGALTGEAAAEHGRAMLMNATGTETLDDAVRVALGRPRVGEVRDSRLWRVRTTPELDDAVADLAEREGRSRSEVIRAAVAEYTRTRAS